MKIRLFGGLEVTVRGEPIGPLRSRSALWLLALLVLRREYETPRLWFAGQLWPDTEEGAALRNLRRTLTDLRTALSTEAHLITAPTPRSIRFDSDGAWVDVALFDDAIKGSDNGRKKEALELYRGPLMSGCLEEWVFQERRWREEAAIELLERFGKLACEEGDPQEAARLFRKALSLNPWRESACQSLMRALSASGDHAAVTMVFRDMRRALRDELNTEPSAETRTLFSELRAIARERVGNPTAQRPTIAIEDTVPEKNATFDRVPRPLTPLIGRGREMEAITAALRGSRLLTLTGLGGVGKTRLAIQTAVEQSQEYGGGVCFVDFTSLNSGSGGLIVNTIAAALGVRDTAGHDVTSAIKERLSESESFLLILDNCEHLIQEVVGFVTDILGELDRVTVLATSRQPLGIPGELVWRVPPLDLPSESITERTTFEAAQQSNAVQLFVERARYASQHFSLDENNVQPVVQICRSLDGIPLALELAAARTASLTTTEIAERLNDQFRLLQNTGSALGQKYTLQGLMDWSHNLLSDHERVLLRRLAVFAGGCDLAAVESICSDDFQTDDTSSNGLLNMATTDNLLTGLVDKSLAIRDPVNNSSRYRLLETVRQYAFIKLDEAAELADLRERHREHYHEMAKRAQPHLRGPNPREWFQLLDMERENIRLALTWSQRPWDRLEFCTAIAWYWIKQGHLSEGRGWFEEVLDTYDGPPHPSLSLAYRSAGSLAFFQGDFSKAHCFNSRSIEISEELGDYLAAAQVLANQAVLATNTGDSEACIGYGEKSLALYRQTGETKGITVVLTALGTQHENLCEYEDAKRYFSESVVIARQLGASDALQTGLNNLAIVACRMKEYDLALNLTDESLQISRSIGHRLGESYALHGKGMAHLRLGDLGEATRFTLESLRMRREMSYPRGIIDNLEEAACIVLEGGNPGVAVTLWGAAKTMREQLKAPASESELRAIQPWIDSAKMMMMEETEFEARFCKGKTLSTEEAVELADTCLSEGSARPV